MPAHQPVSEREAICHGDLHPYNLLVQKGQVVLIDWSVERTSQAAARVALRSRRRPG